MAKYRLCYSHIASLKQYLYSHNINKKFGLENSVNFRSEIAEESYFREICGW